MSTIKNTAKSILPPILTQKLQAFRKDRILFDGDFLTWEEAAAQTSGYEAENILLKSIEASLKVKRGEAAFERDTVLFDEVEHNWPVLTGLMAAAAHQEGRLHVLDFGGALGSSYFQCRGWTHTLRDVRWNVVEQPHYVAAGKSHLEDARLKFYPSVEDCLDDDTPNVVLISSALQYLPSPLETLRKLSGIDASHLIIDRTPFSKLSRDKLVCQKVPASIYSASYPMWIFAWDPFLFQIQENWHLLASNFSPEGQARTENGLKFSFRGAILTSKNDK